MIETIKKHKRIVAVVVILILTAVIELICNFPAIRGGYDDLDLTKYMTVEEEGNREKYVISYSSPQKFYIKELHLSGTFPKEYYYTIKTKEYNSFDKESEEYYSDTVNSWFSDFYTNLNKKVTSVEITLNKPENAELTAVSCSNKFEINKYRVLFFLAAFSLLYCLLFEKKIYKKLEWLFAVYALIFGLLLIFYVQPVKNSWDEQIHFDNAYKLSFTKNIDWTEAALNIKNINTVTCNTKAEYAELREYMNQAGKVHVYTEKKENIVPSYTVLAYVPQAIFLKLGRIFHFSFSLMYAFGKIGNLLLYISVMFWAIKIAKIKQLFLLFLTLMPTNLFLASSYTYDTVVFSFFTLGCVIWVNEMFFYESKTSAKKIIFMILLFTIGSFSKAVYIPIILLVTLLPALKELPRKSRVAICTGIFLVFILVMITFVLPTLTSTVTRDLSLGGDARGGDTNIVGQMISMIKHPWASIKLMLGNITSLDNFRNLGSVDRDNFFFGNLLFLNLAELGILTDKWSALLIPLFIILCFNKDENRKSHVLEKWDVIVVSFSIVVTIALVWLALYLSFTPVGSETIVGVQARYYMPLIYLLVALIPNVKTFFHVEKEIMERIVLISVLILGFTLIYKCVLLCRFL